MRKSIVPVLLLLGAGVAMGAVSQRIQVSRAAPASPPLADAASASTAQAASSRKADVDTRDASLLASKPMPFPTPLPQPEPTPSAWITPFNVGESVDIVPLGEDVVVKTLALPAGHYTVLATLDSSTNIGGICVLQAKAASAQFPGDVDVTSIGARESPGWDPRNEINVRMRLSLQGAVAFDGSGGEVQVACRSFFDSAYAAPQMQVQRPVLSAQRQRAIVLAAP